EQARAEATDRAIKEARARADAETAEGKASGALQEVKLQKERAEAAGKREAARAKEARDAQQAAEAQLRRAELARDALPIGLAQRELHDQTPVLAAEVSADCPRTSAPGNTATFHGSANARCKRSGATPFPSPASRSARTAGSWPAAPRIGP